MVVYRKAVYMTFKNLTVAKLKPGMYKLTDERFSMLVNYVRGDWLDEVGIKAENIKTYDDVHDMLAAWKNAGVCEWPVALLGGADTLSVLRSMGEYFFSTISPSRPT